MKKKNVRLSRSGHSLLQNMAERDGAAEQEVIERALEAYWQKRRIDAVNDAYAALPKRTGDDSRLGDKLNAWSTSFGIPLAQPARARRRRERGRG